MLNLHSNRIEKLDPKGLPVSLHTLNVSNNKLHVLGNALDNCVQLKHLNISGNLFASLTLLLSELRHVPSIRTLCLEDIDTKPSPICKSEGYTVLTRFQLPWLEQLDNVAVGSDEARAAVDLGVGRRRQLGEVNERAAIRDCEKRWLTAGS